jgi:hypothetical protein
MKRVESKTAIRAISHANMESFTREACGSEEKMSMGIEKGCKSCAGLIHAGKLALGAILFFFIFIFIPSPRLSLLRGGGKSGGRWG